MARAPAGSRLFPVNLHIENQNMFENENNRTEKRNTSESLNRLVFFHMVGNQGNAARIKAVFAQAKLP